MSALKIRKSKPDMIDSLLSGCASLAVLIGIFQWAEGHYIRAMLAAVLFLVVVPWLGKRLIQPETNKNLKSQAG